jgi:hypothetical protein
MVTGPSYTISGLIYGDIYQVAVVAQNQYGDGYPGAGMPARMGFGTPSLTQL